MTFLLRAVLVLERGLPCRKHGTVRRRSPRNVEPQILGIGRTSAYLLVKEGHFKIVRIGNAIRISKRSFDEWLESLDL